MRCNAPEEPKHHSKGVLQMSKKEVLNEALNVNLDDFLFHIAVYKGVMATGPDGIKKLWLEERTKLLKSVLASNPDRTIRAQVEAELEGDDSSRIDLYPLNFQTGSLTFQNSFYNPGIRGCLKCDQNFWSTHSGHRLCPSCDLEMRH
jgi:hypothetical protein